MYIKKIQYIRPHDCSKYPFNLEVLNGFDSIDLDNKVTFFVGENGSGKSTLIEAIAVSYGFNSEGGSVNFNFSTRNSTSELYKNIVLQKNFNKPRDSFFLRAESFYNVATEIEVLDRIPAAASRIIDAYGGKSLHEQSHGESFLILMNKRFCGNGLYILDEPEAALSPEKQLSFLARLHELVNANSQFIIATHSPIILSYPYSTIYSIENGGIIRKEYEDTSQYQFMKMFINNYKQILHHLFEN